MAWGASKKIAKYFNQYKQISVDIQGGWHEIRGMFGKQFADFWGLQLIKTIIMNFHVSPLKQHCLPDACYVVAAGGSLMQPA